MAKKIVVSVLVWDLYPRESQQYDNESVLLDSQHL